MKNIVLVDRNEKALLPFTYTRPVSLIRIGILTIQEKWEKRLNVSSSFLTQDYLSAKFPCELKDLNWFINASILPTKSLELAIQKLGPNQSLYVDETWIASCGKELSQATNQLKVDLKVNQLCGVSDIFRLNEQEINADFDLLTKGRTSQEPGSFCQIFGDYPLFIEEGAKMNAVTINTTDGPVYIGKDAELMEGTLIRGPFAACEHSTIKMGAKIYGGTTVGPYSKVGGEVSNSVIFGFSNKGHDGFLGNSVLGEWCNLGADTNNSNLKNNYSNVRVWNYEQEEYADTGLQFCGLIMGDHSKTGINTMLNTGTVVGICANIFGGGFPDKHIPSFGWGGADRMVEFRLKKSYEVAEKMMSRRGVSFTVEDEAIFEHVFNESAKYRMSF